MIGDLQNISFERTNFQTILFFFFYIYKNVFFAYFHVLKMMSLDILNTDVTAAVAFLINGSIS